MTCYSAILRCVLIYSVIIHQARAADGCARYGYGVRCGQNCTDWDGSCTCEAGEEKFDWDNEQSWCCNGAQCEKTGRGDISCLEGTRQPLTTPCNKLCNNHISYNSARQYVACDNTIITEQQCIKRQFYMDETFHYRDRSDEREDINPFYQPVSWTSLRECDYAGDKRLPGLTCTGANLPNDCLPYSRWCNNKYVMPCTELGGRTSVHWDVCNNATWWTGKTCRYRDEEAVRCSSYNSGQCHYPHTSYSRLSRECKDGSHNITPEGPACSSDSVRCQKDGENVCLDPHLQCDLHPNCDGGEDEMNCKDDYKKKKLTKRRGTMRCYAPHYGPNNRINKSAVEMYAVACDGEKPECWEDADEAECNKGILTRFELCK